ncbi:MAG: hypothetical protein JWO52_5188 [Gammaproteobacteria bacterium]|jgi:hypothetical protein|nr:hypothetical protein [Gammaproteobacteria bacterium]
MRSELRLFGLKPHRLNGGNMAIQHVSVNGITAIDWQRYTRDEVCTAGRAVRALHRRPFHAPYSELYQHYKT